MSDFEINLTEVEESGSFDLLPVGDYEFVASGWENKKVAKEINIYPLPSMSLGLHMLVVRYGKPLCLKEQG